MYKGEEGKENSGLVNMGEEIARIFRGADDIVDVRLETLRRVLEKRGAGQNLNDLSERRLTGLPGWVCPVCGRGNAPHVSTCPCVPLPPVQVTC